MERKSLASCQTKEGRKRRQRNYSLLSLQTILFLILLSHLSVRILSQTTSSTIILTITGTGTQRLINERYKDSITEVSVGEEVKNTCKDTCDLDGTRIAVTLKISGRLQSCSIMFQDQLNIIEVDLSGFDASEVTEMNGMFQGCYNLEKITFHGMNTSLVYNMDNTFQGCTRLITVDFQNLDISKLRIVSYMFSECRALSSITFGRETDNLETMEGLFQNCENLITVDLTNLKTSNCKFMQSVFNGCKKLDNIIFGNIDTSNVETMYQMFNGCENLGSLDLSKFDTSKVTNMELMFCGCKSLISLDLSKFVTSKVVAMYQMFNGCENLRSLDLSKFDMSQVTNINQMFEGCSSLEDLSVVNFNTPSLIEMQNAFYGCSGLESLDLSNWNFFKVTNMVAAFKFCSKLKNVDFGNINTPSLLEAESLFESCNDLQAMDLSGFNFSKVKSFEYLFLDCKKLVTVTFGNIPTSSLENMRQSFYRCEELKSIDLSNFDLSKVTTMEETFRECKKIEEIKFGNSPTSSLQIMEETFRECKALKSIDLSSFDYRSVTTMYCLFFQCESLEQVTFGNSPTDNLEKIYQIFLDCHSLKSIDLSNFRTSKVEDMRYLFLNCFNLEYADLSSFDTSNVKTMAYLFLNCYKLTSINLLNFDTSQVTDMMQMFFGCRSFRYVNLSHFLTPNILKTNLMFCESFNIFYLNLFNMKFDPAINVTYGDIFGGLPANCIYCINDTYTRNLVIPNCKFCYCSDSCFIVNYTKIDYIHERCLNSCEISDDTKFEYKGVCELNCPSNTLMFGYLCIDTTVVEFDNYGIEYDDEIKALGYYQDPVDDVFKKCYDTCKYCNGPGTDASHNCKECASNSRNLYDFDNDENCYKICPFYYYYDSNNIYHCTETEACPEEYKFLIVPKKRCIDNCENDNIYKYPYYNKCLNVSKQESTFIETTEIIETTNKEDTTTGTTHHNEIFDTTNKEETTSLGLSYKCSDDETLIKKCTINININSTENYNFIKENLLPKYFSENLTDLFFPGEDGDALHITDSKSELSRLRSGELGGDVSIVDLGECETLLKQHYGIADEDPLIILKKETMTGKASEKSIEYEVFEPYNKTKLNLSICSGVNINVYVPMELSEETKKFAEEMEELGYNIFDINDPFYTDYCTQVKSSDGTDMLLSDRVDYIYNNEDAKCQGNCRFSNYIVGTNYINCTCDAEMKEEEKIEEKRIDKMDAKTFGESFYYVLKYSNYKIMKCYKLVFVKDVFKKNKGGIIIFILFILYCCCLIWHIFQGLNPLRKKLEFIMEENQKTGKYVLFKNNESFPPKKTKSAFKDKTKGSKRNITNFAVEGNTQTKKKKADSRPMSSKSVIDKKERNKNKIRIHKKDCASTKELVRARHNPKSKNAKPSGVDIKESQNDLVSEIGSPAKDNKEKKEKKEKKKKKGKKEEIFDDFELNQLEYKEALTYDQRSFWRMYYSLLKREHRIIFTFFVYNDYNLVPVKWSRFIFLLATDMCMNVFFFSDSTMHKIFLNYGKYNFIQQIPQIIYSTIICAIIEVLLCFLSMTDKHMYEIKHLEPNKRNKEIIDKIFTTIRRKLFFYFLITFLVFLVYWYIVAVFCAVYENTQIAYIKDSLLSSLLGFIYPLIIYLIPASFRGCALKCKNNNCLYKLSDIIPCF